MMHLNRKNKILRVVGMISTHYPSILFAVVCGKEHKLQMKTQSSLDKL